MALSGAALWHVRGIDLAALSAVPVLAAALQAHMVGNERRLSSPLESPWCFLVSGAWLEVDSSRPNIGVDRAQTAQGAIDCLDRNQVRGLGYNSQPLGGYLMFADPNRPVFIDGRNDPYARLISELATGVDPFVRWPMTYAVTTYTDGLLAEVRSFMPLIWFDDASQVAAQGYRGQGLRCLLPEGPFFAIGAGPGACLDEALRLVRESPNSWRAQVLAAAALLQANRGAESNAVLDRAGRRAWGASVRCPGVLL